MQQDIGLSLWLIAIPFVLPSVLLARPTSKKQFLLYVWAALVWPITLPLLILSMAYLGYKWFTELPWKENK